MSLENLRDKHIGIWGFGKVGKSVANYITRPDGPGHYPSIELLDKKELTKEERIFLAKHHIHYIKEDPTGNNPPLTHIQFLEKNSVIIPSPGIDLSPHQKYAHKFISELDLFAHAFLGKTIGITGSVGKTTVTHLLSQILTQVYSHNSHKIFTGGNIGTPALEITKNNYDLAILELSSFQLELAGLHRNFAPDLAIWTNFYPNHLDRHKSLENYFSAKQTILTNQKKHQIALLPLSIIDKLALTHIQSKLYFFTQNINTPENKQKIKLLRKEDVLFYLGTNNKIMLREQTDEAEIGSIDQLPGLSTITFQENIFIILSTLYLVNRTKVLSEANYKNNSDMSLKNIKTTPHMTPTLEHRLEKLKTYNNLHNIEIYNDSKSTTPASTLAAVKKLSLTNKPIILLLGGTSKGVDRTPLIQELKKTHTIKQIVSFGKEAEIIKTLCAKENIGDLCASFDTLEKAICASISVAKPGDILLFSPAGASFDLFKDYITRGNRFKNIVKDSQQM